MNDTPMQNNPQSMAAQSQRDADISNLMAQIGGLRSELADARLDAQNQRARADRLAEAMATTLQTCASLRAERDALLHLSLHPTVGTDATDPGPTLVAETRDAMPLQALRGGDGVYRG